VSCGYPGRGSAHSLRAKDERLANAQGPRHGRHWKRLVREGWGGALQPKVASAVTYPSPSCRPVCPGCGARPVVVDYGRVVGTRVCFRWVTRHCGSTCRGSHTHIHTNTHIHTHMHRTHIHIHAHTHTGPFVARLKASSAQHWHPTGCRLGLCTHLRLLRKRGEGVGLSTVSSTSTKEPCRAAGPRRDVTTDGAARGTESSEPPNTPDMMEGPGVATVADCSRAK
jgi:hypothetical protein